ncbi:MAG: paraquat-inducible protein A [Pseudomonadota bacterium]
MTAAAVRSARAVGYVGCDACGRAVPMPRAQCPRCGARLSPTGRRALDAVWAWLVVGIVFYVPANLYPMLYSTQLGRRSDSTIIGGAFELFELGSYGVAIIVLFASVAIPLAKFAAIIWLALLTRRAVKDRHRALRLYEVVEFIGRWSMIDVFVVAILAALVQIGFLASLAPGPAAAFFAISVAATMLSARAFDPRLIWDGVEKE